MRLIRRIGVRVVMAPSGVGRKPIKEARPGYDIEVCPLCRHPIACDANCIPPDACTWCGAPKPFAFEHELSAR